MLPPQAVPPFPRATVAVGFVTGMLAGVTARGMDARPLLSDVGIDPLALRNPNARVSLSHYAALYNHVVEHLADEGFGLFFQALRPGMFEYLCRVMVGAKDLGEALDRAAGFLRLVLTDLALSVNRDSGAATIEITETSTVWTARDDPRRVFAFEWLLRLIHGLACWLVGRSLGLDAVQFPYPRPRHATDYALIYTEHPRFAGKHLIARLEARLLALPVRRDQAEVSAFLEGAPGKIAVLYRRDHDMAHQISDVLADDLAEAPDLPAIAGRLHISLRTLQRRLKREGSNFRMVKAALRRNAALALVANSEEPIAEIALKLGYAEPSAFFRAFVHWTGEAPTRYRKRFRNT